MRHRPRRSRPRRGRRGRSTPGRRPTSTASSTARQLGGNAYFTLRQASLSEVYYPDLSTPSLRGLQFAVTDGRTFVDRETVEGDAGHIEPVAPGVTATVEPLAGTLRFRQVTETARWRLTKTWLTDPARAAVLVRVRFESKTGRPLRLFVLADPAPGDDGNDDRGPQRGGRLVAYDDDARAPSRRAGAARDHSGYRGHGQRPVAATCSADRGLTGYDATSPATSSRPPARGSRDAAGASR